MARSTAREKGSQSSSLDSRQRFKSTFGYQFEVGAESWRLCKDVWVRVGALRALVEMPLQNGLVATLAHIATTWSPSSVAGAVDNLRNLFLATQGRLTTVALINYRASLDRQNEWKLASARTILRKWHALGYPGIGNDALDLLDSWRLAGGIKGNAVKRRDPVSGPLTDNELLAFNEGAIEAYERGNLSLSDLCLCLLTSHSGRRSRQIVYLKLGDLKAEAQNGEGALASELAFPRLKQRGGFRAQCGRP